MKQQKNQSNLQIFQFFWPYIKPYRYIGVGFIAVSLAIMAVDLVQAYLLQNLIDSAVAMKRSLLFQYLTVFIAIFIAGFGLMYFDRYLYGLFSAVFLHDFRYHAIRHIQKIPVSIIENYHSGDLMSRLSNDTFIIHEFISNSFLEIFRQYIVLVAATIYMVFMNWQLLVATIVIIPPSLIGVNLLMKPLQGYYTKSYESLGKANSIAQDAFGSIFTVKSFNLQTIIGSKYSENIIQVLKQNVKCARILHWIPPFDVLLRIMPNLICIAYGGYLVIQGKMTAGELIAFNFLLYFVQWPLAFLPDILNRIKQALSAAERVAEILNLPNERTNGTDFTKMDSITALSFENVTFVYTEGTNVLNDLNFEVLKGQKIAIVGASGCGKSTIFKLICGNYENHPGTIKVLQKDTRDWNLDALRSLFAIISQEIFLFPVSIYENIAYGGINASQAEIVAAAEVANAHEFIMELPDGYNTLAGERGMRLSGGQKQRIALARAILKNPPFFLLDEPTSALDTQSEALVQEAIERTLKDKTALIIAHRLSTIKRADRILVMEKGYIVEQGTHEQLLERNGLYTQLYLKQFNSAENPLITELNV